MTKTPRTKAVHLDDTAKAIVQQLQIDGRRSYSEIGKAVGLSEAAVRQRVQHAPVPALGRQREAPQRNRHQAQP